MTASLQLLQFDQLWDGEGRAGRYSSHSPSPSQWRATQAVGYLRVCQDSGRQSTWKCPAWWIPIIHSSGLQGGGQWPEVPEPHLGLAQQLLELRLWQEAMVLHKGRDLRGPLALIVHGAMDLHVLVQDGQELLLALHKEGETMEPPSHSEGRAGTSGTLALGSEDRGSL